jgi:putative ABC transport system permease protein
MYGKTDYRVTGVFKMEDPSHIDANFFTAMRSGEFGRAISGQTNWAINTLFHTYIKLRKGTSPKALAAKLPAFMARHGGNDLKAAGLRRVLFLQPVPDIHLKSALNGEISANSSVTYLYVLGSIAAFTLLLACINFMNLSTARASRRAREVGIRKVMGGEKGSLVAQFLGESVLLSLVSLLLALSMALLVRPLFNQLAEKNIRLSPVQDISLLAWMVGLAIVTGLLAGSYPAFYLSSFQPIGVLKGKFVSSLAAVQFRRALVVFQFVISIGLVLCTLVINKQMRYLKSQPLGFQQQQQLVIPLPTAEAQASYPVYREAIEQIPGVVTASGGATYPGHLAMASFPLRAPGKHVEEAQHVTINTVDVGFTETLGFTLVAGRSFSLGSSADTSRRMTAIVLNETAVHKLGYTPQTAIGKPLYFDFQGQSQPYQVIGVVKDFHFQSLHQKITPYGFVRLGSPFSAPPGYLLARVNVTQLPQLIASLENHWKRINPSTPFEYSFLDQDFLRNYQAEGRVLKMVSYFTAIAIMIACLGLYGLIAYTVEQRTKEIGIRKVLGASQAKLILLLVGDFLKLVLVANMIAWPLGWWIMNRWLEDFAYRTDIAWWIFALTGGVALLIALLSVSAQAIKATLVDPVRALRLD